MIFLAIGLVVSKDHAAARASERLVGRGGGDMGMREGGGVDAGCHKACEMGHIDMENGADLVGDLPEAGEIDDARIGGTAGDDHLGTVLLRQSFHLGKVDKVRVRTHAILDGVEPFAGKIGPGAMGEMAAGIEAHAEDRVAGLGEAEEDRLVRLRAGACLDIGVAAAEERRRPVDRQLFRDVDELTAAVVTPCPDSLQHICW